MIALYCGAAPAGAAKSMIGRLIDLPESAAGVLAEAYFASASKLAQDDTLRDRVIERAVQILKTAYDEMRFCFAELSWRSTDRIKESGAADLTVATVLDSELGRALRRNKAATSRHTPNICTLGVR